MFASRSVQVHFLCNEFVFFIWFLQTVTMSFTYFEIFNSYDFLLMYILFIKPLPWMKWNETYVNFYSVSLVERTMNNTKDRDRSIDTQPNQLHYDTILSLWMCCYFKHWEKIMSNINSTIVLTKHIIAD